MLSRYLAMKSYSGIYYTVGLYCTSFANITLAIIQHYPDVKGLIADGAHSN